MARRRSIDVRESFEELAQLREYYANTPNEPLIHLLHLLKEDNQRTITECAKIAGLSKRKAERVWKAYREGGVGALVDPHYLERNRDKLVTSQAVCEPAATPDIAMLNHLGTVLGCDSMEKWLLEFRSFLYRLFPEVDYIFLRVLTLPDHYSDESVHTVAGRVMLPDGGQVVVSASEGNRNFDSTSYLKEAEKLGISLSAYSDPEVVEIFWDGSGGTANRGQSSMATFLFFRKKGSGPVPQFVLNRVELLRPFLSSVILKFARRNVPVDQGWTMLETAIERVSLERDLSITEKRVLILSLCGKSPQEVADDVSVSISTVRSHLSSIYQKLGVSGKGEAFSVLFGLRS